MYWIIKANNHPLDQFRISQTNINKAEGKPPNPQKKPGTPKSEHPYPHIYNTPSLTLFPSLFSHITNQIL